jgi:hypothetical protein
VTPLGDQAIACLKTLTDTQRTAFAVAIAEAELRHGTPATHEMRSAIALGVLSGLGVNSAAVDRAAQLLRRPTLSLVH